MRKQLCPFCNSELYDLEYSGSKVFAKDRKALDYVRIVGFRCLRMVCRCHVLLLMLVGVSPIRIGMEVSLKVYVYVLWFKHKG